MNKSNYKILIVDDEPEYQNVVSLILEDAGYTTASCSNGEEAIAYLMENAVDLVITDLRMPVMSGEEMIKKIQEFKDKPDIIISTAYGTIESAVDSIKMGVADYFVKSGNLDELLLKVGRLSKMKRLEQKSGILVKNQNSKKFFLRSKNPEFCKVIDMCERVADTDISVLLLGESGVGKEVVANYIHRAGNRRNEPFIAVNCQVYSEGVLESELFGHQKGAFTGAIETRVGKFEEANYGTLFLDEIGDLPMNTQGKLLRALENKRIEPVGSNKSIDLDVRFIFATNKDLNQLIEEGKFREDLLYRINTLTVNIPPLRQRREDLPELIDFLTEKISIDQKKKDIHINKDVMDKLLTYDYPGNIRELKNILERMIALSQDGVISIEEFPLNLNDSHMNSISSMNVENLKEARGIFEKQFIEEILKKNMWNVEKSAVIMGITSRQLWNKIKSYDIKKP